MIIQELCGHDMADKSLFLKIIVWGGWDQHCYDRHGTRIFR